MLVEGMKSMVTRTDCQKVKHLMKVRGISQSNLADKLGVSQPYISKLLSNSTGHLGSKVMDQIADALLVEYLNCFYDPIEERYYF